MSSQISDITVEDFANAEMMRTNFLQADLFSARFSNDIRIASDLIPQFDSTIQFGNADFRINTINCNDVTANTLRPDNLETITFFGNLLPSIDNVFDLGIATQRWRQLHVDELFVTDSTTLGNIILIDANTCIQDDIDPTKQFKFQASSITTGTTRTFTVPNANTTLVGTDVVQTITNKTITGTTNTVRATQLATTGADVVINAASPPTINQVLVASTPTTAVWTNASSLLMGSALTDNQFINASVQDDTTSGVFANIANMAIIADVPGNSSPYLFLYNCTCFCSNNSTSLDFSFAINGTTIAGTVIRVTPETKERNVTVIYSTSGVTDGQIITPQWRRSAGAGSGSITFREMLVLGFGTQ